MKLKKKLFFLALIVTLTLPISIYAATKIKSVNISIDVEDDTYERNPDLVITTKSDKYSVDDYEVTNDLIELSQGEAEDDGPGAELEDRSKLISKIFTCEITLSAANGYDFYSMQKSDIKISGFNANCIKATRKDSGNTLVLTVELPGIKSRVGKVESATWNEMGKAVWTQAQNATSYTLKLYNDGKSRGSFNTGGLTFDFSPVMLKEGTYHYTVKPEGESDNKTEKTESRTITITKEQAEQNREQYAIQYEKDDLADGPNIKGTPLNLGWQFDGDHYFYRENNGMYIQTNWLQQGNDWYFFDKDGYMVTGTWIKWKNENYYFDDDGKLIQNKIAQDESRLNDNEIFVN
ncbi:hypothetical protein [Lacrimispora amygdalina]|uniref:hypothetical protein n=1 Tax=Lacrimispora amygdalina TaxID=253257 RepID=UPI000BE4159A|nr:hypothetical protein [Lacrimispora amygdalina]